MLNTYLSQYITQNGAARQAAVSGTVELANLIPPTVSYESQGNLLIVGPYHIIIELEPHFSTLNSITLLATDPHLITNNLEKRDNLYVSEQLNVSGYLGAFMVTCLNNGTESLLSTVAIRQPTFDIVLDMSLNGFMTEEVPVPGYYPVGRGYPKLATVLDEIPELIGTFDKPKYFRFDADLCAHSSRGVKGCERCIDSCPAGALTSEGSEKTGHHVQINPYLCQGVGTCATSCPTEAISYAYPDADNTQHFTQRLLKRYYDHQGKNAILMFCSKKHAHFTVTTLQNLPENVIPVELEDLPSVGIDTWLSALVNGAAQILFVASRRMPKTVIRVLEQEINIARSLLKDLDKQADRLLITYVEDLHQPRLISQPIMQENITLEGNKREKLFAALDCLADNTKAINQITKVDIGAPFGKVTCKTDDCTLCMSCVAVCPTRALHASADSPQLLFIEQDCVQCGLCEKACPEQVISLQPQMNWNADERRSARVLHQEPAAQCICCDKPFAPQSMVDMLINKLQDNPHFNSDHSLRRLSMCEDCRVKDIFNDLADNPEQQLTL